MLLLQSLQKFGRDIGFSWVHQQNLVYVTCWEDPRLDRVALNLQADDTVLVITSAGCNALEYALDEPKQIYAVDVNPKQNALLELKIAAIRELDFEQFFELFGRGRLKQFDEIYDQKLRSHLSSDSQGYWDKQGTKFFGSDRSFYFRGTTGNFALAINYYIDHILKIRPSIDAILNAKTSKERQEIYQREVEPIFWKDWLYGLLNSDFVLWMLGVPAQQRQQMERYLEGNIATFIRQRCEQVFTELPIQDNYFWRVFLNGEYSPNCCPEYLKEENFHRLKSGLVDRIQVHSSTITNFLESCQEPISRFVLLDHMDWLSQSNHEELQKEWQAILLQASETTRILFRSGAFQVEYLDKLPVFYRGQEHLLENLLSYDTELADQLHQRDRVQTYGSFYIADLVNA
ncbi:MAG: BtaA family protein [Nostocaceae cyanobacterium]|nr:BtaA family protein [Nostocaceae cyanobacterium]